jgi:hypothetical protein
MIVTIKACHEAMYPINRKEKIMKKRNSWSVPRLLEEVRERLAQGSAHKNKKAYNRKRKHSQADD